MTVKSLSLRDLEYVVAVAKTLHFGQAARGCRVSQPALSAQIRKVEDQLGIALFERTNRKVVTTLVGELIVRQAHVILGEAEKLDELSSESRETLSGTVRIGAIATLGPYLLPHWLGPLRKAYPKAEFVLREGLTDFLTKELKEGRLDMVLASPTFDSSELLEFPLFFEPFVLAVPKEHPLAKKNGLKTSDLRSEDMVLLEEGHCLKDQALGFCGLKRRVGHSHKYQATSLETLRHLVASGLGYTLVPLLAVTDDVRLAKLLEYREIEGRTVGRVVSLYCRDGYSKLGDVREFAKFARTHRPKGVTEVRV